VNSIHQASLTRDMNTSTFDELQALSYIYHGTPMLTPDTVLVDEVVKV